MEAEVFALWAGLSSKGKSQQIYEPRMRILSLSLKFLSFASA